MRYEEIQERHMPEMAKMYVGAFNAPPWNDRWTDETITKRLKQMMHCEGFYGLVGFEEGNGNMCAMALGNHEFYYDGLHFQIKEFCVSNEVHGQGLGSAIMSEFERRLAEKGIDNTYLFTLHGETTEGFYRKRGYRTFGGMVMMGKRLEKNE